MSVATPTPRPAPTKVSLLDRAREAPVLCALTAINLAVMLYAESRTDTTSTLGLIRTGADEATIVWMGDYWRLATSMFLHVGWGHFLWNTYASWGWCAPVEKRLGHWRFLTAYLVAGIGGSCASVLGHDVVSAGSSGALFGIIGARLVLEWRAAPDRHAFFRKTRGIFGVTAVWVALGFGTLPMDTFAHAGGLVTGVAATWLLTTGVSIRRSVPAIAGATWAFFVIGARPWHVEPTPIELNFLAYFGQAYADAEVLPLDLDRAERFLGLACDHGSASGCYGLGSLLKQRKTYVAAMTLFRKACDGHENGACWEAAYLSSKGLAPPIDRDAAPALYASACDAGCVTCCSYGLGNEAGSADEDVAAVPP